MSVRKVHSNGRTIVGYVNNREKSNAIIQFESRGEKEFLDLLQFDSNVKEIFDQPVRIPFVHRGKDRSYVPDFLVNYNDSSSALFEIKTEEGLKMSGRKFAAGFRAAREYGKVNNQKFHVFTESVYRTVYTWNIRFLLQFKGGTPNLSIQENILTELGKRRVASGNDVLKVITSSKAEYDLSLRCFWVLLFKKIITCDLFSERVTLQTPVWICDENHPAVEFSYPYKRIPKINPPRV